MSQATAVYTDPNGALKHVPLVAVVNPDGSPVSGGAGGGGGSSNTTEATAMLIKTAVQNIDVGLGAAADAPTNWYTSSASVIQLLKLAVAAFFGAGSHVYSYSGSGQLVADAWTLLGTTRTKTYTYTAGRLTGETDWI